jgi:hypothetical protein
MTADRIVPTHTALGRFHLTGDPIPGNPLHLPAWWRGAVASLFLTNLELPDDLALGRSVSHGFGWFRRAGG